MTTTAGDLVTRVRSNINESASVSTPLRTDSEIITWMQDAVLDYMHKVPQEHFPELTEDVTFSGPTIAIPDDYLFFHSCTVTRTISGTTTGICDCFVLTPGETYFITNYPGVLGAYCKVAPDVITCGPNVISGTLTYVKHPVVLTTSSTTFSLGHEHESAMVNKASAMALLKVNDAGAEAYLKLYDDAIAAKAGRGESKEIERA